MKWPHEKGVIRQEPKTFWIAGRGKCLQKYGWKNSWKIKKLHGKENETYANKTRPNNTICSCVSALFLHLHEASGKRKKPMARKMIRIRVSYRTREMEFSNTVAALWEC